MVVEYEKGFSLTDLYITIKSYTDSIVSIPIQILIEVEDREELRQPFLTASLPVYLISDMTLLEFTQWFNDQHQKNSEYIGSISFTQRFFIKFILINFEPLYPIYPWKTSAVENALSISSAKDIKINELLKRIEILEDQLKSK